MTRLLTITRFPAILMIAPTLLLGFFCAGAASHASMHSPVVEIDGTSAISTHTQGCCNAGISKYIGSWKSTLSVITRQTGDAPFMLLLGLVALAALVGFRRDRPGGTPLFSYGSYVRDNPDVPLLSHLQLAFSRGILNPKIY